MGEVPRPPHAGPPGAPEADESAADPRTADEAGAAEPAAPARPSRMRRALRWLVSPRSLLGATGLLMLVAVSLSAVLLLPPAGPAGDLPGEDALGQLAPRTIKANRAYTIPDFEATQALQSEASRAVRPVWDLDAGAGEEAASRISQAFVFMREQIEDDLAARRPARRREPSEDEIVRAVLPHAAEFMRLLQAWVDDAGLRELARERFSVQLQDAARALARRVLQEEIVASRDLLLPVGAPGGIVLRPTWPSPGRGEREARDVSQIADVASVRAELARLADGNQESRFAAALPEGTTPAARRAAASLVSVLVAPTLAYNALETDVRRRAAAAAVKPVVLQYVRGERIVGDGERVEKRHLVVFRFIREQSRALDTVQVRAGAGLFTALFVAGVYRLARATMRRFRPSKRDLVFLSAALAGNLALARAVFGAAEALRDRVPLLTAEVTPLLLPLAAGTMLVRLLRSGELAAVFAMGFAPLAGVQLGSLAPALVGLVASAVAATRMRSREMPRPLPVAAVEAGIAAALAVLTLALFDGRVLESAAWLQAGAAFAGTAVLSPLAAALAAPPLEALFSWASDAKLARLANLNHPVLKELIIKAPGTYHHSILVAALAEAAARAVGANPLLARVGGYYHDLGKSQAPLMFLENQKTENRLEKLPPIAAAGYLRRHVQDGLDLGRAAHLPAAVLAFIGQHHGTRPTGRFHERACELAEREGLPPPDAEDYRYPGPRPRTREVALVMLSDAVEGASRARPEATPEELRALVPRVADQLVAERQFEECDLTLGEVRTAVEALQQALVEVHGLSPVEVLPHVRPPPPADGGARPGPPALRLMR